MSLEARILDTNYHGNTVISYGNSHYNFSISPGWQNKTRKSSIVTRKKQNLRSIWNTEQIDNFICTHLKAYEKVILEKYNTAFFKKIFAKQEITSVLVKIFLVQAIIKEMGKFKSQKIFTYEIFPEKIIFSCSHEVYDVLEYARENLF